LTMSVSAPAGIANKNIGRLLATCTMETMNGSGSRLVMSQAEATLYIQPPMLETTVAIQINVNTRWRNGAHAEAVACRGEIGEGALTLDLLTQLTAFGAACDLNPFARAHIVIDDTILQTHIAAN
jgi:hypothetical protein